MSLIESGRVLFNRKLATGIFRMELALPEIAPLVKGSGQFISLHVGLGWQMPLRRPMSIASVKNDTLSIIYKILGRGTEWLQERNQGDLINILGPMGNTFSLDRLDGRTPILLAGGVGIAPILFLHEQMILEDQVHNFIIGAVTADEHFQDHNPKRGIYLTTDDGSLGIKGNVLVALELLVEKIEKPYILACGPKAMLMAIQKYAMQNEIHGQIAVESYMACGTGLCQGCVVETSAKITSKNTYLERYSLVCKNGPVYDLNNVRF